MADSKPNILFLMTDQMQGRVLDPGHPCITPMVDKLAERGVRVTRAYTTNPVCSPARASLMTGLQPHTHRIIAVTHCLPDDMGHIDRDQPHWAQHLADNGYKTGYFGKWHVERSETPTDFGWHTFDKPEKWHPDDIESELTFTGVEGYPAHRLYGVTNMTPEERFCGKTTTAALDWLDQQLGGDDPWCCFVSCIEPHDPFVCGKDAYEKYDVDNIPVPDNWADDLADRPGLYRKAARVFKDLTLDQKKQAAACYYAMITEVDQQYARLIDRLEQAGELDNTIIVFTSDHGEMLGAHGLYMKNVGAFEEAYHIPMVVAGPGVAQGETAEARVGLQDVGSTLADLCGIEPFVTNESRSFAPLLRDPANEAADFTTGYAEYAGTRYWFSQRIIWDGDWKLVWNGFDFDELYNLAADPGEMTNLIDKSEHQDQVRKMMRYAWDIIDRTNDHPLGGSIYPCLRLAPYGMNV